MADPTGTETVEEAKKRGKDTPTQPEREHFTTEVSPKSPCGSISLGRRPSRTRRMVQKMKKLRSLHSLHRANPRRADTDAWCFLSPLYRSCGFCRYLVMFDLLDLYFRTFPPIKCILPEPLFLASEVCRKSQEYVRNLRIRFYRLVGRVRTLRVPMRRLGALTRGASLDVIKVPLGDHFGRKTNV